MTPGLAIFITLAPPLIIAVLWPRPKNGPPMNW